ncbi:MAG: thiol:disulfide interchange protein DsbD [Myxococcales bacterium]
MLAMPASASDDWLTDHAKAIQVGAAEGRPVMLDFWAKWCVACIELGKKTFPDPAVTGLLDGFVLAKIDMDAPENQPLWDRYSMSELPQVWFLRPDGTPLTDLTLREFEGPQAFAARLARVRTALGMPALGVAVSAEAAAAPAPASTFGAPSSRDFGDVPDTARADRPHVTARLLADSVRVAPGEPLRVGVHIALERGWHVYWKNSGDSGLPTEVELKLPEGYVVGELQWPAPGRYAEAGGLTAYGYSDEVMLYATVVPPPVVPDGPVPVSAAVSWLVCEKNCVPGSATLSLTLPGGGAPGVDDKTRPIFDHMAARVPPAASEELTARGVLSASAVRPGDRFAALFEVRARRGGLAQHHDEHVPVFLPEVGVGVDIEGLDHRVAADGALIVRVLGVGGPEGRTPGRIAGVVQAVADDGVLHRLAVSLEVPLAAPGATVVPISDPAFALLPALPDDPKRPAMSGAATVIAAGGDVGLWQMLLFALIGGLLLNVMPCVLPVLSIKALGLVRQAGEDRRAIWHHGLAFGAGVMVSFLVLTILVIGLKASGELVGWGFQFQNPAFVVALMAIVFAFSLSLFGVFEVNLPGMQAAAGVASQHGLLGSFFNGVFATLLATPCTAPFLGTALGFAFGQPSPVIFAVLMVVGLGLALPFVILARFPAWLRKIPRPGPWMDHFKHLMGFLLVGTVIWLLDVLSYQVSTRALVGAILFLGIVAVAVWMYGRFGGLTATRGRQVVMAALAGAVIAAGAFGTLQLDSPPAQAAMCEDSGDTPPVAGEWTHFTDERVTSLSGAGHTVFIDFTAAWCWTCKVNENTVIESDAVLSVMRELGIIMVRADWTNKDEAISAWLRRFDRAGVPLYVILPGSDPDSPIVLPEILTPDLLIEGLRRAGPSQVKRT